MKILYSLDTQREWKKRRDAGQPERNGNWNNSELAYILLRNALCESIDVCAVRCRSLSFRQTDATY